MGILDGNNARRDFVIERTQEDKSGVTKHDLDQMRKQMRSDANKRNNLEDAREVGVKGLQAIRHGFSDVAKSLATPDSDKRPRIARIGHKGASDMKMDINKLENMKHHSLRSHDIRGRRVTNKNGNENEIEIIKF